jgi:Kef-type K+ transport system membrane component KefB
MQDFILILLFGVSAAWLAKRFGQPAAVAQILLGLIIGPPLLGWIEPGEGLQLVGQLGIVLLLGMAGLHLEPGRLARAGWTGFWVALPGMLLCLAGGYAFALWWGSPHAEAIYVGTALTATSIGISVQVLHQLGLIDRKVGRIVIAAAVIDDVVALYLLAIAHGILCEAPALTQLLGSMLLAVVILAVIFVACRWLAQKPGARLFNAQHPISLFAVIVMIVTFGWLTETMGYSLVVGGFFAGLGLGDGLNRVQRKRLVKQLERLVLILAPFFFVIVGSKAEWGVLADSGMPLLVIGLLIVAMLGKIAGGFFGAWRGRSPRISLLIGVSMTPRGEVALVIASLGYAQGHISHHVLVALILVTIGAALLGPLLMARLARSLE